jgi:hypothetical protein
MAAVAGVGVGDGVETAVVSLATGLTFGALGALVFGIVCSEVCVRAEFHVN